MCVSVCVHVEQMHIYIYLYIYDAKTHQGVLGTSSCASGSNAASRLRQPQRPSPAMRMIRKGTRLVFSRGSASAVQAETR